MDCTKNVWNGTDSTEVGLAQLVSAQPSVREVPSLIPRCDLSDLKSFFQLFFLPCSIR